MTAKGPSMAGRKNRRNGMEKMDRLLEALADCGEAAAFYRGTEIVMANRLFAGLFCRSRQECKGLPIVEIIHEDSLDMINDFIHRRAHGDIDLPTSYRAKFRSPEEPEIPLLVTVIRTCDTERALLVILQRY